MGETVEKEKARAKVTDAKGVLQQNREFLDFFWDIAKPEQEVRLGAVEHLVQYLRSSDKVGGSVALRGKEGTRQVSTQQSEVLVNGKGNQV